MLDQNAGNICSELLFFVKRYLILFKKNIKERNMAKERANEFLIMLELVDSDAQEINSKGKTRSG